VGTKWIPPTRGDVALVLFLVVLELTSFGQDPGLSVDDHAVALLLPLALLVRRTAPAAAAVAFLIATACADLLHLHSVNSGAAVVAMVVAAYSAGAYLPLWPAVGTLALWGAAFAVQGAIDHSPGDDMAFPVILLICAAVPGILVRRGREQAETARGEVERSATREAALAEQAVVDERARIARELHDVVAHAVSIMVVQAAAADELLERDPARAHAALDAVQRTGRSAIEELARMLELLRGEGDADTPLPTLGRLPALLDEARASGVDVDLVQDIAGPPLPPAVELCVYRVVQEALTNAAKHTLRPRVQVRLSRDADGRVEILVENDGGAGPRSSDGTGHGLLGLRERVSVFGGRLDAAPRPDGGYRVVAVVPTGANA